MCTAGLAKDYSRSQKGVRLTDSSLGKGALCRARHVVRECRDAGTAPQDRSLSCRGHACLGTVDMHDGVPELQGRAHSRARGHCGLGNALRVGDNIWLRAICQRVLSHP